MAGAPGAPSPPAPPGGAPPGSPQLGAHAAPTWSGLTWGDLKKSLFLGRRQIRCSYVESPRCHQAFRRMDRARLKQKRWRCEH